MFTKINLYTFMCLLKLTYKATICLLKLTITEEEKILFIILYFCTINCWQFLVIKNKLIAIKFFISISPTPLSIVQFKHYFASIVYTFCIYWLNTSAIFLSISKSAVKQFEIFRYNI